MLTVFLSKAITLRLSILKEPKGHLEELSKDSSPFLGPKSGKMQGGLFSQGTTSQGAAA
jgi:hypothetical protein